MWSTSGDREASGLPAMLHDGVHGGTNGSKVGGFPAEFRVGFLGAPVGIVKWAAFRPSSTIALVEHQWGSCNGRLPGPTS